MTKSEKTKKDIIMRSAALFNERGFAGCSVDDIVEKIDVTRRSLYKHFDGKEALAKDVVDYLLDETLARTRLALKSGSALKRLYAYLDLYKNPYRPSGSSEEVYIDGGCPILNFGVEYDDGDPGTAVKVVKAVTETLNELEKVIRAGVKDKEFQEGVNASQLALKIFSSVKGGILVARLMKDNHHMHQIVFGLKEELRTYNPN